METMASIIKELQMAMPKLKPIEERDRYAASVLDAFDALGDSFPADADEQMTVGLDCCPHYVPHGSECFECDEEDTCARIGIP